MGIVNSVSLAKKGNKSLDFLGMIPAPNDCFNSTHSVAPISCHFVFISRVKAMVLTL